MLEQQQTQLVNGLRELYQRALDSDNWVGMPLKRAPNGFPLTHDILERMGALKIDASDDYEPFEDDFEALQRKAYARDHEVMSPRSSTFESRPSSKRTSRNPTFVPNDTVLPNIQFPPTPPDQSPTEPTAATFDTPFGTDTPMSMDSVNIHGMPGPHGWLQSPEVDAEMDFLNLDVTAAYTNMGLMEQKVNPCLSMSAYHDDELGGFGLSSMLS